jgi:hypothetical protein
MLGRHSFRDPVLFEIVEDTVDDFKLPGREMQPPGDGLPLLFRKDGESAPQLSLGHRNINCASGGRTLRPR